MPARKRRRGGTLGWVLGVAAMGAGAGLAAERFLVGRRRLRPDPYRREPYGKIRGDRSYEVDSFDGATLVVDEVGPEDATAGVIFLHGFCLDRTVWHHQYRAFGGRRRYLYYDARHHGRSRGGAGPSDTKTLAADLEAVLDRSGLQRAILVGHSMGGMTVLEYCRTHPEELGKRIKGIVLVNTTYTDALKTVFAAELIGPLERRLRRALEWLLADRRAAQVMRMRGDDLSWIITRLGGFGPGASSAQIEFTQRLLTSFPSPPLIEILRGLRNFDMQGALHAINVAALVIAGGTDRITTVRASRHIATQIPDARLVVIEDAGHMTMLERQDRFNPLLGEFVQTNLAASRRRRTSPKQESA